MSPDKCPECNGTGIMEGPAPIGGYFKKPCPRGCKPPDPHDIYKKWNGDRPHGNEIPPEAFNDLHLEMDLAYTPPEPEVLVGQCTQCGKWVREHGKCCCPPETLEGACERCGLVSTEDGRMCDGEHLRQMTCINALRAKVERLEGELKTANEAGAIWAANQVMNVLNSRDAKVLEAERRRIREGLEGLNGYNHDGMIIRRIDALKVVDDD